MTECRFCKLLESPKNVLYEDDKVIAIVPEKPAIKGHIQVIAKKHVSSLQDLEDKDTEHIFYAASFSATALFENLQAEGTNIMANTGGQLKQGGHFHIDVIARKNGDPLNFLWKPKKLSDGEMNDAQGKIKDKCAMIGYESKKEEVVDLDKKEVEKLDSGPVKDEDGTDEHDKEKKKPQKKEPEPAEQEKDEKPSEDKIQSPEPDKPALPSEEEQRYRKNEKHKEREDDDIKEDDENYLVKQLRRMP